MNFRGSLTVAVIFVICLICTIRGFQSLVMIIRWNAGALLEYKGTYTVETKKYLRNTNYLFTLENGDIVSVPCENMKQELMQSDEIIIFRYSSHRDIFKKGNVHIGISIATSNGHSVYLQEDHSKKEVQLDAFMFLSLGLILLFFTIITSPLLLNALINRKYGRNNKSSKQRKKVL